jgi:hypothetical protein
MKILAVFLSSIALAAPAASGATREALLLRLTATTPSGEGRLAPVLTPLLLDYLEATLPRADMEALLGSASREELAANLSRKTNKDVLDLGEALFAFHEARTAAATMNPERELRSLDRAPFRFRFPAGTPAEKDIDLIARDAGEAYDRLAAALDLRGRVEAARALLTENVIEVSLHPTRSNAAEGRIRPRSFGQTTFGATIVEDAAGVNRGRLKVRIDILYPCALSLAVLEHEVAHAVILLGTFETGPLVERPLGGKSDLAAAFRAGYRKLPAFLLEGLGDHALYFGGFQKAWGLVGEPTALVGELHGRGKLVPLAKLLSADSRFRAENHKVYSLEAASFLDFLLRTRGKEQVRRWLFSGETNGVKGFQSTFGKPVESVEKEWLESLATPLRLVSSGG